VLPAPARARWNENSHVIGIAFKNRSHGSFTHFACGRAHISTGLTGCEEESVIPLEHEIIPHDIFLRFKFHEITRFQAITSFICSSVLATWYHFTSEGVNFAHR
jgi:hypothetical protein